MTDGIAPDDCLVGGAAQPALLRRTDLGLATPWEQPRTEAELKLARIWEQVFGIDQVGNADDFFELGGDLFAATALAAEIEATFGVQFAPATIIQSSTIAKQARIIAEGKSSHSPPLPSHMIVGRAGGSQLPFFLVHGALGYAFFEGAFIDEVGQDRPVYLFQAPGLDGRTKPLKSIEEFAASYVAAIRQIQPSGPYYIGALCSGSFIALEMCNQLEEAGQSVARLILIDPYPAPRALAQLYETKNRRKKRRFWRGARRLRSGLYRRLFTSLGARIPPADGMPEQFKQRVSLRAKEQRRFLSHIERRRTRPRPPEERSYSPEAMLIVTQQLHEALTHHVPRPYSGKAAMLVNANKMQKTLGDASFWRTHLGGIDFQVMDSTHREIFDTHIVEMTRFVKNALDPSS